MPGISRDNDTAAGDLVPSQGTVYANGEALIVLGDSVASHAPCPIPASHCAATMGQASSTVFVGGIGVCRAGDTATCGHVATGSGNVGAG